VATNLKEFEPMPIRKTYTIYDEDELAKDYVLKDREGARFTFRDSAPRRSKTLALVTDGTGGTVGLHQPGYRLPAKGLVARDAVVAISQAYQEYERGLCDAWRNP
jgi:hypothetical protein